MPSITVTREIDPDLESRYVAAGLWGGTSLRDGLERWAGETPDRIALVDADRGWTYAELERLVATVARHLVDAGVSRGTQVLVVARIGTEAVATYLAILRLGGIAVMLDRRAGRQDVQHAVEPLDVGLVVAGRDLTDALGLDDVGAPVTTYESLLAPAEPFRDWDEPDLTTPAAVFFTSGTTSRPKSVIHSINTLRAGARNMADALALGPADVAFLSSPLASITGVLQVHLTLERGAGIVLEDQFQATRSLARLVEHGATVLGGAPVIAEELIREAVRQDLSSLPLRAISLGGAMIPRDLLELALNRYLVSPVRIYGSSEGPVSTHTLPSDVGDARLSDDGAAARGTEVMVDESRGGEILLRGPMQFLGYLHDTDNADAFAPGGWYRTGDLGEWRDGRLKITGRIKEVVVRKGLKISIPEIDAVVRGLPGVGDSAAFAVPDEETGEHLAVALVEDGTSDLTFEGVTEWLLESGVAKWKLPEEIVVWSSPLPRTASGKIQRRLLPDGGERALLAPRLR